MNVFSQGDEVQGSWINLSKRMVKYAPRGKISFSVITSSGREYSGSIHKNTNTKGESDILHVYPKNYACSCHNNDVVMSTMASQITGV